MITCDTKITGCLICNRAIAYVWLNPKYYDNCINIIPECCERCILEQDELNKKINDILRKAD